jgi:hypothetical protein
MLGQYKTTELHPPSPQNIFFDTAILLIGIYLTETNIHVQRWMFVEILSEVKKIGNNLNVYQ